MLFSCPRVDQQNTKRGRQDALDKHCLTSGAKRGETKAGEKNEVFPKPSPRRRLVGGLKKPANLGKIQKSEKEHPRNTNCLTSQRNTTKQKPPTKAGKYKNNKKKKHVK